MDWNQVHPGAEDGDVERSEQQWSVSCAGCGEAVWVDQGRAFAMEAERALCFRCAAARGGRYDEARDEWSRPPDVSDLEPPQ